MAVVSAMAACSGAPAATAPGHRATPAVRHGAARVVEVSRGCRGRSSAEPIEAVAPPAYVYVAWIGCGGIGFARSTDGGRHFGKPILVPGSKLSRSTGSWDPAITVSASGTLYVAYMFETKRHGVFRANPAVATSFDHGATFPRVVRLTSKVQNDFGDRDFIAAGPAGHVYVTWDYGPSSHNIMSKCARYGSCYFTAGDVNAVIQVSADGGKTWGPVTPVGPNFPRNGGISAPVLTQPGGRVDVLYLGHAVGKPPADKLSPGREFFTSSATGRPWPAHPAELAPARGAIALPAWWIDGSLARDAGGTLYATWDTQTAAGDIGWLTWSASQGKSWARPVPVTPGHSHAMHIVQVTGGPPGIAYVGWQTSAPTPGYATYVRAFSTAKGWLGAAARVSSAFGNRKVWPGDTIGLAVLPGAASLPVAWGGAPGASGTSQIWATTVTVPTLRRPPRTARSPASARAGQARPVPPG